MKNILLLLSFTLFFSPVFASDMAKEKRWAEQIEDGLMDGESAELNAGDISFYTVYTEAGEAKDTAILLLHGLGVHPDWQQVINPLRTALPEKGWSTLSIQLPILENGAPEKDYKPLLKEVPARLESSITFLREKGAKNVLIIAHSHGAQMATYALQDMQDQVTGFVGIGMGPDNADYLPKLTIPVYDLYGENDLEDVLKSVEKRAKASKDNKNYKQTKVKGASHFFDDMDEQLIDIVVAWLKDHSE
ncbi:MAG: Unknown protein [uncultured Thiotrichaceae bacterium]|uniref:DUF3530 domain-containing protein n=1 Tax=uncultured Thiotrichaceae bacterium TaxID=298394 RepID=A0A6S6SYB4_9GAMM|nr:MAG: Unknown protein [uncultured Thiotrichaceae bacterium]